MTTYNLDPEPLPEFPERTTLNVLVDIAQALQDLREEVRQIRNAVGSNVRSSVELAENAKGAVQIAVKAYVDSPIDSACIEAVAGFRTLKQEVERGIMDNWAAEVERLRVERGA